MPANVPFIKTSFALLTHEEREYVVGLYTNHLNPQKKTKIDATKLSNNRLFFPALLTHYTKELTYAKNAFLTEEEQGLRREELLFTFYLLYSQYQLDELEGQRQTLASQQEKMTLCSNLIQDLHNAPPIDKPITPAKMLARAVDESNKGMRLLGLTIVARWLVDRMYEVYNTDGKTVILKDWMDAVNGKRLYWVWGGGMLASVLDLLSDDFFNKMQAQERLGLPSPFTGNMSWMLYYARGGIQLFMLLKHTIRNDWMEEDEKDILWTERFQTQWAQRKFFLLNDSIWATANMVCFFWLKGSGMAGYYGNVLTAGLLLMDVTLTTIKFHEECTKHNKETAAYDRDMAILQEQIDAIEQKLIPSHIPLDESEKSRLEKEKISLQAQKDKIAKMKDSCEFNWKFTKYGLINDLIYAIALLLAFAVNCSFFLLPGAVLATTALNLAFVGALLCFALTTATTAMSGILELNKTKQSQEQIRTKCKDALLKLGPEKDENLQKQYYLTIQSLINDTKYHQEMVTYQRKQILRSVLIDSFLPMLVFVSLFLPTSKSLAVLAVGLVLGEESNRIIENSAPNTTELPKFDDEKFKDFTCSVKEAYKQDTKLTEFSAKLLGETKKSSFFTPKSSGGCNPTLTSTSIESTTVKL